MELTDLACDLNNREKLRKMMIFRKDHFSAPGAMVPAPGVLKLAHVLKLTTSNLFERKTSRLELSYKKFFLWHWSRAQYPPLTRTPGVVSKADELSSALTGDELCWDMFFALWGPVTTLSPPICHAHVKYLKLYIHRVHLQNLYKYDVQNVDESKNVHGKIVTKVTNKVSLDQKDFYLKFSRYSNVPVKNLLYMMTNVY